MSIQKEYEVRTFLSEDKYFELASFFITKYKFFPILSITNTYFDTNDTYLKNHSMVLRCRVIYGKGAEFTLKVKGDNGDTEYTDALTQFDKELLISKNIFPNGNVKKALLANGVNPLDCHIITELHTKRMEIDIDNYQYFLDKNTYSEIVDYDLEVESKESVEHADQVLKKFCTEHDIPISEHYTSKSRRAINEALKNQD